MPASGVVPLLLALWLGAAPGERPAPSAEGGRPRAGEPERGAGLPSPELIEFLGEFSTPGGGFLDPRFVDRMLPRPKRPSPE